MNILITGGAGFIGSNLAQFHVHNNDTVTILDNLITGRKENISSILTTPHCTFIEQDITTYDFSQLPSFDIIYHLASPASPKQYKKYPVETLMTNSLGTYNLLEFARKSKNGVFVLASTSETYGDPLVHPQPESYWGNVNPIGLRSCYDEAKRFAEALTMTYFRKYTLDTRIARIFNTYGPNMEKEDGRVISNFIVQALMNKPITVYGDGQQTRSFCFVSDMVEALHKLATTKNIAGEIVNLGNPEERSIREMAELIQLKTGTKSQIVSQPIDEDDPKKRKPDISKANRLLNWEPIIPLEQGINTTIQYFKEHLL